MNARKGKIARLPDDLREQVNLRLLDGEPAETILQWLNRLPKVKAILKAHFGGAPINKQNLSDWRQGGFCDWQTRCNALQFVEDLDDQEVLGHGSLAEPIGSKLAHWVALQYAASAKAIIAREPDPAVKWGRLNELCANVARLRRGELAAQRLDMENKWIDFEEEDRHEAWMKKFREDEILKKCVEIVLNKPGHKSSKPANTKSVGQCASPPSGPDPRSAPVYTNPLTSQTAPTTADLPDPLFPCKPD